MAEYMRTSLIALLDLPDEVKSRLLSERYMKPRGPLKTIKYLHGHFSGEIAEVAAPGQEYPIFASRERIKTVIHNDDGTYSYEPEIALRPVIANGAKFNLRRFEIWDGSSLKSIQLPKTDRETGESA